MILITLSIFELITASLKQLPPSLTIDKTELFIISMAYHPSNFDNTFINMIIMKIDKTTLDPILAKMSFDDYLFPFGQTAV